MKNTMKKQIIHRTGVKALAVVFLATLFASGVVFSQPRGPRGERGVERDRGPRHEVSRLAGFLELTDAQKADWKAAHEAQTPITKDLREKARDNRVQLHEAIESETPNPTTIGELTLAGRDLRKQMEANREQLRATLESFLTAEQIEKWQAYDAARGDRPRGFRGRGPGAGGPGHGRHGGGDGQGGSEA